MGGYGDRLKQELGQRGVDAGSFALKLGVKERTVYAYLSGDAKPSFDVLTHMAREGVDVHWVLTGELSLGSALESEYLPTWLRRPASGILAEDRELGCAVFLLLVLAYSEQWKRGVEAQMSAGLEGWKCFNPGVSIANVWATFQLWAKQADSVAAALRRARSEGASAGAVALLFTQLATPEIPADPIGQAAAARVTASEQ
jgi:transcriptional regulator with XRE-family HTH domain